MAGMDHDSRHTAEGMESQQLPAVSIYGDPLFGESLLAATRRQHIAIEPAQKRTRKSKFFVKLG
jgi:hypothetical protein